MAVDVLTEIVIARPVELVARYVGDPSNAPEWYANIESVEWQTPPPVALGSRMDFVAHFLGRRLAYTYEIVEWEPLRRLVMRTAQGPFPMETSYEWSAEGCRLDPDEPAQPWRAVRVRRPGRAGDGRRHASRQPEGPQSPARDSRDDLAALAGGLGCEDP